MNLDVYQSKAFDIVSSRKSLALVGSAGSGKSFVLLQILDHLREMLGGFPVVAACGLSNVTATRLNGRTIHALFGAPPHWRFSKEELWNIVRSKPHKLEMLRCVEVIIVDEICVLTAVVFDSIDYVFRKVALSDERASLPFGGRQIVVAGDPFQLQAISQAPLEEDENSRPGSLSKSLAQRRRHKEDLPAYKSRAWFLTFGGFGSGFVVFLEQNYRQKDDRIYLAMLNRVRVGNCTAADIDQINKTGSRCSEPPETHTQLCLKRRSAYNKNYATLSVMPGPMYWSKAVDTFLSCSPRYASRRLEDAPPSIIHFKVGSAVLLTRSIGDLTPGCRVTVEDITVRRNSTSSRSPAIRYLVDRVVLSKGPNRYEVGLVTFSIRRSDTTVIASRRQLPFIPAYAITVHKSQGMTMSRVAVDFRDIESWKPAGMVYVALSRCKNLAGIWARGLTLDHVRVSIHALDFLRIIITLRSNYPNRIICPESMIIVKPLGHKSPLSERNENFNASL